MMKKKLHDKCAAMIPMRKNKAIRCLTCLLPVIALLWLLSGCGGNAAAPAFPPAEETVQAAAEKVGWTMQPDKTESWEEGQVLYTFAADEQTNASVSCTLTDGNRILVENCVLTMQPDKPQFAWEDWEKAVTLAETLYGDFSEGEMYQALSEQAIPEPEISSEGSDEPTGKESLRWEVELPVGYGRVCWSICGENVENNFPSPTIRSWRTTFSISLYESKEAYEKTGAA